jgi:hypothetical protein
MRSRIASSLVAPVTTERAPGAVLLRAHSHRDAHGDRADALAQVLVLLLAAIGLFAWVASRFFSS